MVHNLRSRNICGTSDKLKSINGRRRFVDRNQDRPQSPALEQADPSTPLLYTPSESLLDEIEKCSDPVNNTPEQSIGICSTPRRYGASFLTSTRLDQAVVANESGIFTSSIPSEDDGDHAPPTTRTTTGANYSSYTRNIFNAVDESIFSKTYKTAKGLSLYGIRKAIREFGYDPKYCKNKVRLYVRECLQNCKFVQFSGRGANGSFRLNDTVHKSFIKAHKTGRISKNRTVSSIHVYRKRFMSHDMAILNRMVTD